MRVVPGAEGYAERETLSRAAVDAETGAQTAPSAPAGEPAVER